MMSDLHRRRKRFALLSTGALALIGIMVAVTFVLNGNRLSDNPAGVVKQVTAAKSESFPTHETPRPLSNIEFYDAEGQPYTLADFRGKTILLNIWATWCVPCREEMPTLDALQEELGGDEFEVVALSIDRAGPHVVRNFDAEIGIQHLGIYIDSSMQASFDLSAIGLPTTLLMSDEGREAGRLIGPTEWNTPQMIEFFKSYLTTN